MGGSLEGPNDTSDSPSPEPDPSRAIPILPIDHLMAQLVDRAGEIISAQERLRKLLGANRAIVGELSLPSVLRRIVEAARELVGARYAALGVIGADGLLEQFVHVGMTSDTVATIGELPKGRGLLGALIQDPHPIRLPRIQGDERSSGFPAGHPPMDSFLGVPIRSRNAVYGNLYLTCRANGEFTAEDEELVMALAATAGIAIENARLYEESRRRSQWLQASAEINSLLMSPGSRRDPQQLIVDSVLKLADADVVTLVLPVTDQELLEVEVAAGAGAEQLRGLRYDLGDTLVGMAMETGRGVRVGSIDEQQGYSVHLSQAVDVGAVMAVPLVGEIGPHGAIMIGRLRGRSNFTTADLDLAESFARYAALARELVAARADQQRLALLEDRDRIARDLHDHVIQRLFATGLSVQSMAAVLGEESFGPKLSRIVVDIDDTIRQVRTSIFQLKSTENTGQGLRSAVLEVTGQVTPLLGFDPAVRFTGPADTVVTGAVIADIEAVVREGLTNVAKHARATEAVVQITASGSQLWVDVSDNGEGLGSSSRRSGLDNLRRRAEVLGGALTIDQNEEKGTRLQWTIPISP
ncbi:MAG: GAF domain-containing sensor histidine kinase [Propionibacteriaceae bacterium]